MLKYLFVCLAAMLCFKGLFINDVIKKGDQKVTGGRGVSEKGDVINEQKYIGIGRQFRVFMPIITK